VVEEQLYLGAKEQVDPMAEEQVDTGEEQVDLGWRRWWT
jgi:hypothetical protein